MPCDQKLLTTWYLLKLAIGVNTFLLQLESLHVCLSTMHWQLSSRLCRRRLVQCRYGKESPGPSAYNLSGGMGRQVLSDHESLPAWQMGTDKRFQYDFIKRTQGMPGPGQPTCLASLPLSTARFCCHTRLHCLRALPCALSLCPVLASSQFKSPSLTLQAVCQTN